MNLRGLVGQPDQGYLETSDVTLHRLHHWMLRVRVMKLQMLGRCQKVTEIHWVTQVLVVLLNENGVFEGYSCLRHGGA